MKLNKCFYTLDETFPFLKVFNHKFPEIMDDLKNVDNWIDWPEYGLWNKNINPKSDWNVYPLVVYEKFIEKNIKECPTIYKLLKNLPNLVNASFSKLGPKTKLKYHMGWKSLSNNVLRCHLGLVIPSDAYIYCCYHPLHENTDKENKMKQEVNNWIVFDDSKWHSADNQSDDYYRIVLIIDIKRPEHIEKGISNVEDTEELKKFISKIL